MLLEGPPLPFWPTRPPAKPSLKLLLLTETLVVIETVLLACEEAMAPVFSPTSPPMMLLLPPETLPLADDDEIVPPWPLVKLLLPTSPPAKFNPQHVRLLQIVP